MSPKAKNIVDDKVHSYSPKGENNHQGYNLHQIMKWFEESIPEKQILLNEIQDKAKRYDFIERYKVFDDVYRKKNLKARIEKMYSDSEICQKAKIITLEEICKFYMLDKDLILNGEGFVYYAKLDPYIDYNENEEEKPSEFKLFNKVLECKDSTNKEIELLQELDHQFDTSLNVSYEESKKICK